MFAFPVIGSLTSPVVIGGVTLSFSLGGALLGWTLIAALVGTALGLLRDSTSPRTELPASAPSDNTHLDVTPFHREAA